MNKESRVKNSMVNFSVTTVCHFLSLGLSFIVRTFFINKLGANFLGINGLYTNILTVLSLAELGVGSAIGFSLYKPVVEHDEDKISALMRFYKFAYRVIFCAVTVIGLILIPFLDDIITTDREIDHLVLYYVLFLANSSVSYLFAYKSTLLYVNQENYITKILNLIFSIVQNIGQLAILFLTQNFALYIVVQIVCTVLNNLSVSFIVDKKYGFIKTNKSKLEKSEQKEIFKNVGAMFTYQIGGVLVNNTDNILISKLISITATGLYSNYTLIVNSVSNFLALIMGSASGSIGNFNVKSTPQESQKLFEAVSLFNYWVFGFSSVALYCLLNDFINLWLSTNVYLLDQKTIIAIVLSFFVMGIGTSTSMFRSTTGLFKETKYVFLVTAAINLVLSVILGIKMGLCGIIFATSISKLATNIWFEPYRLYQNIFKMSCVSHFLKKLLITVLTIISCIAVKAIFRYFPPVNTVSFVFEMAVVTVVPNIIFFIAYHRTEEFHFIVSRLKPVAETKIKKLLHR